MFCFVQAPSGVPEITLYRSDTPTSIYLEWSALQPHEANGVIRSYDIGYVKRKYFTTPLSIASNLHRIVGLKTFPRNYTIIGLNPYTEYIVGVAALNSKKIEIKIRWLQFAKTIRTMESGYVF